MISLGWKENSYFYGNADIYVNRVIGSRERKLLKWSESNVRGLAPSSSNILEEVEPDAFKSSADVSEEDMLLPSPVPNCILSLPLFLNPECRSSKYVLQSDAFQRSRATKTEGAMKILRDLMFAREKHTGVSLRATKRHVDPLLLERFKTVDTMFFLDYLPLLRCMAVHERVAESVFCAAQAKDPDAVSSLTNRGRSTRRTKKLGREHYFEGVVPGFAWQKSSRTAKDVGSVLANSSLLYEI